MAGRRVTQNFVQRRVSFALSDRYALSPLSRDRTVFASMDSHVRQISIQSQQYRARKVPWQRNHALKLPVRITCGLNSSLFTTQSDSRPEHLAASFSLPSEMPPFATATSTAEYMRKTDKGVSEIYDFAGLGGLKICRVGLGSPWSGISQTEEREAMHAAIWKDRTNFVQLPVLSYSRSEQIDGDKNGKMPAPDIEAIADLDMEGGEYWRKNFFETLFLTEKLKREELVTSVKVFFEGDEEFSPANVDRKLRSTLQHVNLSTTDLLILSIPSDPSSLPSNPCLMSMVEYLEQIARDGLIAGYGFHSSKFTLGQGRDETSTQVIDPNGDVCLPNLLRATKQASSAATYAPNASSSHNFVAVQYPLNFNEGRVVTNGVADYAKKHQLLRIADRPVDTLGPSSRLLRFLSVSAGEMETLRQQLSAAINHTVYIEEKYEDVLASEQASEGSESSESTQTELSGRASTSVDRGHVIGGESGDSRTPASKEKQASGAALGLPIEEKGGASTFVDAPLPPSSHFAWGKILAQSFSQLNDLYEFLYIRNHEISPELLRSLHVVSRSKSEKARGWAVAYSIAVKKMLDAFTAMLEWEKAAQNKKIEKHLKDLAPSLQGKDIDLFDLSVKLVLDVGADVVLASDEPDRWSDIQAQSNGASPTNAESRRIFAEFKLNDVLQDSNP